MIKPLSGICSIGDFQQMGGDFQKAVNQNVCTILFFFKNHRHKMLVTQASSRLTKSR